MGSSSISGFLLVSLFLQQPSDVHCMIQLKQVCLMCINVWTCRLVCSATFQAASWNFAPHEGLFPSTDLWSAAIYFYYRLMAHQWVWRLVAELWYDNLGVSFFAFYWSFHILQEEMKYELKIWVCCFCFVCFVIMDVFPGDCGISDFIALSWF